MSRTIIITGASDGIGAAAARQLARNGHQVVVVGRSPERTQAVAASINAPFFLADFSVLDDVRRLADQLGERFPVIDVLANNAGGVFSERRTTPDGFELTFQVNHLAPFLLTHLLMPTLLASKALLLQTSSVGARTGVPLEIDNLNLARGYSPVRAYGWAKLENLLFSRELHRRYHSQGLSAVAFHPGNVASSFGKSSKSIIGLIANNALVRSLLLITPEKAGAELARIAGGIGGRDWVSGQYYEKSALARKPTRQMTDDQLAARLWEQSARMLGIAAELPARAGRN